MSGFRDHPNSGSYCPNVSLSVVGNNSGFNGWGINNLRKSSNIIRNTRMLTNNRIMFMADFFSKLVVFNFLLQQHIYFYPIRVRGNLLPANAEFIKCPAAFNRNFVKAPVFIQRLYSPVRLSFSEHPNDFLYSAFFGAAQYDKEQSASYPPSHCPAGDCQVPYEPAVILPCNNALADNAVLAEFVSKLNHKNNVIIFLMGFFQLFQSVPVVCGVQLVCPVKELAYSFPVIFFYVSYCPHHAALP